MNITRNLLHEWYHGGARTPADGDRGTVEGPVRRRPVDADQPRVPLPVDLDSRKGKRTSYCLINRKIRRVGQKQKSMDYVSFLVRLSF